MNDPNGDAIEIKFSILRRKNWVALSFEGTTVTSILKEGNPLAKLVTEIDKEKKFKIVGNVYEEK